MLLEVFMDHRVPYLFIVPLALGLLSAVGLTGIYRRYRMQLLRNKEKKRGWCAKLQERFEEYYRKRAGLVDVQLFVRGQMEEKRFGVLRLRTWEQLSGQAPALCVGLGVGAALYASAQHFPTDYCLEVLGYGIVSAIVCHCIQQVFSVSISRERVEFAYCEFLENALRPKLEKAYRSAKALEKACRSSVNEGGAVSASESTPAAAAVSGGAPATAVVSGGVASTAVVSDVASTARVPEGASSAVIVREESERKVSIKEAAENKTAENKAGAKAEEAMVTGGKRKDEKAARRAEYATLTEGMVNKATIDELNRRAQADELNRRAQAEEDRLAELRELRLEEIRMRQERRRKEREEREERERRAMEAKAEKERQQQRAKLSEKRRKEEKRAREKQAALQSAYEEKQRRLREKYLGKLQDEYAVSKDRAEQETEIIEDVLKEYLT